MPILNCFKCDKELSSVIIDTAENQPYSAVVFVGYGQYGSTVFDPNPRYSPSFSSFLELNICDECLQNNKDQVHYVEKTVTARYTRYPWNPETQN